MSQKEILQFNNTLLRENRELREEVSKLYVLLANRDDSVAALRERLKELEQLPEYVVSPGIDRGRHVFFVRRRGLRGRRTEVVACFLSPDDANEFAHRKNEKGGDQ